MCMLCTGSHGFIPTVSCSVSIIPSSSRRSCCFGKETRQSGQVEVDDQMNERRMDRVTDRLTAESMQFNRENCYWRSEDLVSSTKDRIHSSPPLLPPHELLR